MKNTKLVVGLEVKRELFRHQKKKLLEYGLKVDRDFSELGNLVAGL